MKKHSLKLVSGLAFALLLALLASTEPARAQTMITTQIEDRTLDPKTQQMIIDSVAHALVSEYVFLDKAEAMQKHIREQFKKGAYKDITSGREFCQRITQDLRTIANDGHLGVRFVPDQAIKEILASQDSLAPNPWFEEMSANNYGFKKLEILDGNVGYMDLRGFVPADVAGGTAIAAMNFLSGCDAVIFDLRQNGGGDPSMIQLITSYLFDQPVHLNSFYIRAVDTIQQFWTQGYVPGKKLPQADVYVLTSQRTFSGGEEFAYNLKNLKRGTIIGKVTGGGAHPTNSRLFASLNVQLSVPYGRAINPITGTNWEGVGVIPDVEVDPAQALDIAHMSALQAIAGKTTDLRKKERLQWAAEAITARVKPYLVATAKLADYVGTYGPRRVWLEGDALRYQRDQNPAGTLVPLSNDRFMIENVDYFRVQFLRDESGRVVTFLGLYDDGSNDQNERTE